MFGYRQRRASENLDQYASMKEQELIDKKDEKERSTYKRALKAGTASLNPSKPSFNPDKYFSSPNFFASITLANASASASSSAAAFFPFFVVVVVPAAFFPPFFTTGEGAAAASSSSSEATETPLIFRRLPAALAEIGAEEEEDGEASAAEGRPRLSRAEADEEDSAVLEWSFRVVESSWILQSDMRRKEKG